MRTMVVLASRAAALIAAQALAAGASSSAPATAPAPTTHPACVFDGFDHPAAWTGPIYQYGDRTTGSASIGDGRLTIRREPVAKWHTVSMKRTWTLSLRDGLWTHVRFRTPEMLLGADLYITLKAGELTLLQMGVNGEQHWIQGAQCQPKELDDELFWGSDAIVGEEGGKRTDIRIGLAPAGRLRYTDWTLISSWYEINGSDRRLCLFVNGHEVIYRDLDAAAPAGGVNNRIRSECLRSPEPLPVSLDLGIFADGDLYADTSVHEGAGVRWLHAFAAMTPARPHVSDPRKAEPRTSEMQFDFVALHAPTQASCLPREWKNLVKGTPMEKLMKEQSKRKEARE